MKLKVMIMVKVVVNDDKGNGSVNGECKVEGNIKGKVNGNDNDNGNGRLMLEVKVVVMVMAE